MAQGARVVLLTGLCLLLGGWHWFEPAARKVMQGIDEYQNGQFDKALESFVSAKGDAPKSQVLRFNTAATLLHMEKYQEALQELTQVDAKATTLPRQDLHYNLGNAQFRLQDYKSALQEYRNSLLADPNDLQAKKNFEITLKKIKEEEKKQDQDNQDQDKNKDQQDQEQQQQQNKPEPHKDLLQYLNQNEREQQKKQRQKQSVPMGREKDW